MKQLFKERLKEQVIIGLSMFAICISTTAIAQSGGRFLVNGDIVPQETITKLEKQYGVKCTPGNYWYDRMTGAFGKMGGPCTGIGVPGLSIGGPLKAGASSGTTRVFINGRELHTQDVQALQAFVQVIPGRYWMDAQGNFGYENNPAIGNLYSLYRSKLDANKKTTSYRKSSPWSNQSTSFGSDGNFMYFSSKKTDGTSIDLYYGN